MKTVLNGFVVYALALLLNKSYALKPFREWFRTKAVEVGAENFYAKGPDGEPLIEDANEQQEVQGYDFISCAMCTGLWIAGLVCLKEKSLRSTLAAYGISYFLRTQERP